MRLQEQRHVIHSVVVHNKVRKGSKESEFFASSKCCCAIQGVAAMTKRLFVINVDWIEQIKQMRYVCCLIAKPLCVWALTENSCFALDCC